MERPDTVLRRYPHVDDSLPARYARAIAGYQHGDLRNAIAQIDALLQAQPNNPYFHELRGQALLEGGAPDEAIAPLRRALQLSNNSPLIADDARPGAGRLRQCGPPTRRSSILRTALAREPEAPIGYMQLAMAYGRKGNSQRPISPPPRQPSCAATTRPRATSPRAPRHALRSARPAGSRPMTSSPRKCRARTSAPPSAMF